jgi:hypothetical protein
MRGQLGVIFSRTLTVENIFLGPFWSMLCFSLAGFGLGFIARLAIRKCQK